MQAGGVVTSLNARSRPTGLPRGNVLDHSEIKNHPNQFLGMDGFPMVPKAGLVIVGIIVLISSHICPKVTVMTGHENQWLVTEVSHDL